MAVAPAALATRAKAATHTVTLQGFAFSPSSLTNSPGDTLVFTNADAAPHAATASNGAFDPGRLGRDESAQPQFASAASFADICATHPSFPGSITVT
ncbi:hypothetical protein [Marivita hallyeonensis]|uniref:Plastocyanin n=1 Tax=Marivita hallyeonensis TaxID=996342 RepID=A0A1M5QJE9_9RHOB|nr:hypothetical protein [Marivita hallyeonensis]SHH14006.1 Plastocyanin [Marivita hallyeonensis]